MCGSVVLVVSISRASARRRKNDENSSCDFDNRFPHDSNFVEKPRAKQVRGFSMRRLPPPSRLRRVPQQPRLLGHTPSFSSRSSSSSTTVIEELRAKKNAQRDFFDFFATLRGQNREKSKINLRKPPS